MHTYARTQQSNNALNESCTSDDGTYEDSELSYTENDDYSDHTIGEQEGDDGDTDDTDNDSSGDDSDEGVVDGGGDDEDPVSVWVGLRNWVWG